MDMWSTLHAHWLGLIPNFSKTAIACKKKFNTLFKQYKEYKLTNEISMKIVTNANSMNPWTFGGVNHILTFANDMDL
jgi:hypothetical protein